MKELNEITDLLYGEGIPMAGSKVGEDEAVRRVRERYPYAEYCLVSNWRWLDLDVTQEQRDELARTKDGLKKSFPEKCSPVTMRATGP